MAQTLADQFLADLDDLSDEDEEVHEEEQDQADEKDGDLDDIETLNFDDLSAVAKLTSSGLYKTIMQKVRAALGAKDMDTDDQPTTRGPLEEDPTYQLLVQCNKLAVDIDNEVVIVHNFIRDKYRHKFPELESLVHHPVDYARVVRRIGNEMDLTLVEMEDMLPAATIMVVTVTGTTTSGKPLSPEDLAKCLEGCDMALQLDEDKKLVLEFVESKMHRTAPNLTLVIGSEVAAKLMGVAGGLLALSKMPACNVQVLGAKKKALAGMSTASVQPHQGFIYNCAIIQQQVPPALRQRAARLLAAKCTLLARVDAYGQDPSGGAGQKLSEEVMRKIEKWQEPPPAKQVKPLPCPDAEVKKRRGGKRLRKMKERYGLTDVRKAANRVNFMQPEEEFMDGDEVVGLGTLGKEGSGRLRIVAAQQKMKLTAKTQKKYAKMQNGGRSTVLQGGMQSSLAFTPVQGFELADPTKALGQQGPKIDGSRSGTESYFSSLGGFRSIKKLG